jgi:hypothetical protein
VTVVFANHQYRSAHLLCQIMNGDAIQQPLRGVVVATKILAWVEKMG